MKIETLAVHAGQHPDPVSGAVMPPIVLSSTFAQDGPGVAVVYLSTSPGALQVDVSSVDSAAFGEWTRRWNGPEEFQPGRIRMVLFDTKPGLSLH